MSPSNEYSGLIFFRIDWFDLLTVQETLKSLPQHHNSEASNSSVLSLYGPHSHLYMTTGKYMTVKVLVTQSCLTLCHPRDCSPPGSSVQGILQARILEWVSMLSSRVSSQPGDRTCISCVSCIDRRVLYHWHHLGSP